MSDEDLDKILVRAAETYRDEVDPALLDRVAKSIGSSLRPVRPLPPPWALATGLVLICAGIALAGAAGLGFSGFQKLSVLERAAIFFLMGILIWLAATTSVGEMIPGSRRRVAPLTLLLAGCLNLLTLFAMLFHDYRTDRFVAQGVVCLIAGLLTALPTALASWLLLRRGFAVNAVAAGLAVATLAGLGGVTMLELHCPNIQAPHVMVWHTAVILVSGAAGALPAWLLRFRAKG